MSMQNVKSLCETTKDKLKQCMEELEQFLNHHTLQQLAVENDDPEMEEFYRHFLSDMRHLLVYCEDAYERLGLSLRRPVLNAEVAERILYDVYHNGVNKYFYPKNECYSEDGRYAYTGQDAIRFRKKPVRAVRDITLGLSKVFENLREELSYYETDYITQRRMQGEKV